MGRGLRLHRDAAKGCILNSRILWFFSRAFLHFKGGRLLEDAAHAYRFLRERFLDPEYDGKHTYSHAFAVYGLSAYCEASGDREALALAEALAALMEERCQDGYGYLEAFDREWRSLLDLSSYGHDIEVAWLTDRPLSVLGEEGFTERLSPVTRNLTEQVYRRAYREGSLLNEKEGERVDTDRIWWVQAEAMVGFYNGFERQEGRTDYLGVCEGPYPGSQGGVGVVLGCGRGI